DDRGDERRRIAEVLARPVPQPRDAEPARELRQQIQADEQAEKGRQQIQADVAFLLKRRVGMRNLTVHRASRYDFGRPGRSKSDCQSVSRAGCGERPSFSRLWRLRGLVKGRECRVTTPRMGWEKRHFRNNDTFVIRCDEPARSQGCVLSAAFLDICRTPAYTFNMSSERR